MKTKIQPKICVLLAAYNGEKWIHEQIKTILNQRDVEIKLFVSIDLSDDLTLEIVTNLSAIDNRIVVLPYGERFGNAGKNFYRLIKDVDICNFDLVSLADQDDVWMEDKLSSAWKIIASGFCECYSSDVLAFWDNGKELLIKKSYKQLQYDHFFEAAGPGCTYVFSKQTFLTLKDFITQKYDACTKVDLHDWLIYAYCRENNLKWFIDNNYHMKYRQHKNNLVGTNNNLRAFKKRILKVKSNWYAEQIQLIAELVSNKHTTFHYNKFFFIVNINKLRRNIRDRIALLAFILLGFL